MVGSNQQKIITEIYLLMIPQFKTILDILLDERNRKYTIFIKPLKSIDILKICEAMDIREKI